MKKTGVGIITCNRPVFLKKLINSLIQCKNSIHEFVVVNDGDAITNYDLSSGKWINNEVNLGVGKSKNRALNYLYDKGCDYFFLIEDDVFIESPNVFCEYIRTSRESGIQHFNYGPGSPFNRKQTIKDIDLNTRHLLDNGTSPAPKLIVDYSNDCKVALYEHVAGCFSFFTRKAISEVGFFDEQYTNAWEHVDHTFRIINANMHPPFWWFADISNSDSMIRVHPDAITNSSISKNQQKWVENVQRGREIYFRKHGIYPNQTKHVDELDVIDLLKKIKIKHG